jgi:hypothetical protein
VWQDEIDLDLGSAGVVLIPNTPFIVTGGKEGILYVLDRDDMGRFDAEPTFNWSDVKGLKASDPKAQDSITRDRVVQKFAAGVNEYLAASQDAPDMDEWPPWPHIHGTPVWGEFADGTAFLYIWPEKDFLKAFRWHGTQFAIKPTIGLGLPPARAPVLAPPYTNFVAANGMPGGMLALTIDPTHPGRGVLFASVQRCRASDTEAARNDCSLGLCLDLARCKEQRFGMLRAFDPITLEELWNNQVDVHARDTDKDYWFSKFVPPTIANGRVYLATMSQRVLVYGRH